MKINILFLSLLFFVGVAQSQHISFAKSKILNLNSQVELLYFETEIRFYTHGFTGDQMKWDVIFDSLDNRWVFDACANGDCRVGLTDTGTFVTDFGVNDTTVFFRYHVNTKGFNGSSKIGIKVYHPTITNINDTLWMNITYYNPSTGLHQINQEEKTHYIIKDGIIYFDESITNARLYNLIGQQVTHTETDKSIVLPAQHGIYFIQLETQSGRKELIKIKQ